MACLKNRLEIYILKSSDTLEKPRYYGVHPPFMSDLEKLGICKYTHGRQ